MTWLRYSEEAEGERAQTQQPAFASGIAHTALLHTIMPRLFVLMDEGTW